MKKMISLLLVMVMVFSLAACSNKTPEETKPAQTPTTPVTDATEPSEDDTGMLDERIKMIFENDGITIKMTKVNLDKVSGNIYKNDSDNKSVILDSMTLTFYDGAPKYKPEVNHNPEDELVEEVLQPIVLKFENLNYNLLSTDDLTAKTVIDTTVVDTVLEAFPGELLRELRIRDYGQYCVIVGAKFVRTSGDESSKAGFSFNAEVQFEEAFDVHGLYFADATLNDTGAKFTLDIKQLAKAIGLDPEQLKNGDTFDFEYCDITHSTEKHLVTDDTMEQLKISGVPGVQEFTMEYKNATESNDILYRYLTENQERAYVCMLVNYNTSQGEGTAYAYFLTNITAEYTGAPQPETPTEPTTPPVSEPDTEGSTPEETTGGTEA